MELICAAFILVFGTLGHFIFEWSGHRTWAGIFFAVNESTWEHIKLSIYPSFVWACIDVALSGGSAAVPVALAAAQIAMILLIPGLFYGYTSITGKNWLIPDIICFMIAVAAGSLIYCALRDMASCPQWLVAASAICLVAIGLMYFFFSYRAPHNFLFRDPISGGFGPKGHGCHTHFHQV